MKIYSAILKLSHVNREKMKLVGAYLQLLDVTVPKTEQGKFKQG